MQTSVEVLATAGAPAFEADHAVEATVQFHGGEGAGRAVQPVHVLGDHGREMAGAPKRLDGPVAGIGLGPGDRPPAHVAARPVPAAAVLARSELLVRHRRMAAQAPGGTPVVGDARLGGQAGATQDGHAPTGEQAPHRLQARALRGGLGLGPDLGPAGHRIRVHGSSIGRPASQQGPSLPFNVRTNR